MDLSGHLVRRSSLQYYISRWNRSCSFPDASCIVAGRSNKLFHLPVATNATLILILFACAGEQPFMTKLSILLSLVLLLCLLTLQA